MNAVIIIIQKLLIRTAVSSGGVNPDDVWEWESGATVQWESGATVNLE